MSYRHDSGWQEQFIPEIRRIVGPLLLEPAPLELDFHEATDLVVLRARDMRIACRVRRYQYLERYGWQFTIRSKRDSGTKTELQKLVEGWGDWLFYAFASPDGPGFARWFAIDLHALRTQWIRRGLRTTVAREQANRDGSHFVAFNVLAFDSEPPVVHRTNVEGFDRMMKAWQTRRGAGDAPRWSRPPRRDAEL